MSACVIAEFPWAAIESLTNTEQPGVIVCSDTRITRNLAFEGLCAKQLSLARNIFVCFTSSHVAATIRVLEQAREVRNVRRIGQALRATHLQYGGSTELVVVVSGRNPKPGILELMPPHYVPTPRSGVIGIGDRAVLASFRQNFLEQPRPDLLQLLPPGLPRNRYLIHQAAVNVGAAFVEAIDEAQAATVGLPILLARIVAGEVRWSEMASSKDQGKQWQVVSADRKRLGIEETTLPTTKRDTRARRAEQLFS